MKYPIAVLAGVAVLATVGSLYMANIQMMPKYADCKKLENTFLSACFLQPDLSDKGAACMAAQKAAVNCYAKMDPNECQAWSGSFQTACWNDVFVNHSLNIQTEKYIPFCYGVKDRKARDLCFYLAASKQKQYILCHQVVDPTLRTSCNTQRNLVYSILGQSRDRHPCTTIDNDTERMLCYQRLLTGN